MIGRLGLVAAGAAVVAAPFTAPTYHVLLMLPFMAYGVVLLGLNLLFGYTGLVSFGHALFIGIGAYTGAFLTSTFGVRSLEAIVVSYLDDMDSKIQGFEDLVARDYEGDPHWTPYNNLFERPLYKYTREDLEESLQPAALPSSSNKGKLALPGDKKKNKPGEPLTNNLGDLLKASLKNP